MQISWAPTHEETKLIRAVLELADRINGLNENIKIQLIPLLTQIAYMEKTANQSPYFPLTKKSIGYLNQIIEHVKHNLLQLMTQEVDELLKKEQFREITSEIGFCILHGDGKVPNSLYHKGWRAEKDISGECQGVRIWKIDGECP